MFGVRQAIDAYVIGGSQIARRGGVRYYKHVHKYAVKHGEKKHKVKA